MYQQNISIVVFVMSCAAFVNIIASVFSWWRRKAAGALQLSLLLALVAIWALTNAFEMSSSSIPNKILWGKISYIGVVNIAPLWLLFSLFYSQKKHWMTPKRIVIMWIYPLFTLLLVFTNEIHRLIWPKISPLNSLPGSILVYDHGVGVYLYAAYSYTLLLFGTYWLIHSSLNSARLYRFQVTALVTAVVIPWVANILYFLDLNPWPGVDLTILAFTFTGTIATISLYGFRVLDLAPIAREVLFNSISSGVVVLDGSNRIVDFNPTVRRWTGLDDSALGSNFFDVIKADEQIRKFEQILEGQVLLQYGQGTNRQVIDMVIAPLRNQQGNLIGRVASLHDVSREHGLMDAEQKRARQIERLNDITHQAILAENLEMMLQPLVDRLGDLFGADEAFIALWDENHRTTRPAAAFGPQRDTYPKIRLEPGDRTLTDAVIAHGKVLVIDDTRTTEYQSAQVAALFPRRSMLAMPLVGNTQKMGSALISYDNPHVFSQDEIILGQQAAGQVSLAMERVRLLESEKRYIAQLTALQSLAQSVLSSLDLKQIFETVVQTLNMVFHYQYVSIYEYDGKHLLLGAQINYPPALILAEISIDRGVMGRSVRTKQPQFIRNIRTDPDFLLATYEVESEICVPLLKGKTVLGTLNIESLPPQVLTDTDMLLMTTFAGQVAIAIEHAKIFNEMQRQAAFERTLQSALRDFSAGLGSDSVLQSLIIHLLAALEAQACFILKWDSFDQSLTSVFSKVSSDQARVDIANRMMVSDFPMSQFVLERKKPVLLQINPIGSLSVNEDTLLRQNGFGCALFFPLIVGRSQQPFGIVQVFRKVSVPVFSEFQIELGMGLLAQAAVALENANLYTEMEYYASVDDLTGLLNRRRLIELGRLELERAIRFHHSIGILFLDIDHFKTFNDLYSYSVGDQVLKLFSKCLQKICANLI